LAKGITNKEKAETSFSNTEEHINPVHPIGGGNK